MMRRRVTGMAVLERAKGRYLAGDFRAALVLLDEAIRARPEFARARYNRAITRQAMGDLVGALADLEEALRLEPDLPEAVRARTALTGARADETP